MSYNWTAKIPKWHCKIYISKIMQKIGKDFHLATNYNYLYFPKRSQYVNTLFQNTESYATKQVYESLQDHISDILLRV